MGRLAIARRFAGQGLGAALLADALTRALRAEIPAFALIVDAKDDKAAAFYRHHGLIALQSDPLTLFLPLATAAGLAGREERSAGKGMCVRYEAQPINSRAGPASTDRLIAPAPLGNTVAFPPREEEAQ